MPPKRTGGRKKGAGASGKKRTTGGGKKRGGKAASGKRASKPTKNKATPKQSPAKKQSNKKEKQHQKRKHEKENKASGEHGHEGGGGGDKREIVGNLVDQVKAETGEILRENLPAGIPVTNPVIPGINTISKETNTQTQSQENVAGVPQGNEVVPKSKRIKDPAMIAAKVQIQGIAASRSLQLSALIPPQSFMMNRFGATFIPPSNISYSASNETGKISADESDTASTSGDDDED